MDWEEKHVLFLSRRDVEEVNLNRAGMLDLIEKSFMERGKGNTVMHPKAWYEWGESDFFCGMTAYTPGFKVAGVKWQSGVSENPNRGLPYINGYIIINNLENGLPLGIIDSTWVTATRTGLQTAVTAKYLARKGSEVLSMIGCGVQARTNLQALLLVLPKLKRVQAFDINEGNLKAYVEDMRRLGVEVIGCKSVKESIMGGDIIVTAGPLDKKSEGEIEASWLKKGVLAVPLDCDCYWKVDTLKKFDKFFVDDTSQALHFREETSYCHKIPNIDGDFGEIVTGKKPGREKEDEKIMCLNLGVAFEDTPIAFEVYKKAKEKGIGVWLPR